MYNKSMQPTVIGFFSSSRGSAAADLNSYIAFVKLSLIVAFCLSYFVDVQACAVETQIEQELELRVEIAQGQLDIVDAARDADRVVLAVATYSKNNNDSWTIGAEFVFEVTRDLKGNGPKTITKESEGIEEFEEVLVGCFCARTFNEPKYISVQVEEEYVLYMREGAAIRLAGFKRRDCEVPVEEEIRLVSRFLQQKEQMQRYYESLDDEQ